MIKVKDLIEVLSKLPQNSEIYVRDFYDECYPLQIFGVVHDSEGDDFGGLKYSVVEIVFLNENRYENLVDEEIELYGDKVWYNTQDNWSCYKDNKEGVYSVVYDGLSKKFKDV